jgi:hypothetical protein
MKSQQRQLSQKRVAEGLLGRVRRARLYVLDFVRITQVSVLLRVVFPSKSINPVRQFCALVALCGCDFARNLPRLGPSSLWKIRQRLQTIDPAQLTHSLCALSLAYHDMFVNRNTVPERCVRLLIRLRHWHLQ